MRARSPSVRTVATGFLALGVLLLLPAVARAAPGPWHEDEKLGYKVRTPKGWTEIPLQTEERWMVARFLSDRSYTYTDPTDGWTFDHKPEMTVIVFIAEVVKKRGIEKTDTGDGFLVELSNPFKDYEDFLGRTYSGGGWYISEDEKGDVSGVPVRKLEIKVEKLASTGPKRIVTWVFHTEEVDFAVQFEVLEGSYDKLKADMKACLASFRLIPRQGSLVPPTTGEKTAPVDEGGMTPEARVAHRKETERALREKAAQSLPAGWTAKEMGPFLVLSHVDEKYARKLVSHAEAVWKWLEETFPYVGAGEYARLPVIRICESEEEYGRFLGGTAWGSALEIVSYKDTSEGEMGWSFEKVNRGLVRVWFGEKDQDLYWAFPHWLDSGLDQVVGTARAKGGKLEFQADQWELEALREAVRKKEVTLLQDLLKLGFQDFYEKRSRTQQSAAFVRMLLDPRNKKTREILQRYIQNLDALVSEEDAKADPAGGEAAKEATTEEEEEEQLKNRRQALKDKEKEFLQQVFQKTFGDFTDKDWLRLNDDFVKSLG